MRDGEIEYSRKIAPQALEVWEWDTPAGKVRAKRRGNLLSGNLFSFVGDTCLELGCGTGLFSERLSKCWKVTAVDISPDLLRRTPPGSSVSFILDDAENLDFWGESFDYVVGSSVLHHLDLEKALPEILRVLKRGGNIIFAEPNLLNPQIWIEDKLLRSRHSKHEAAFTRWTIASALRRAGFEDIHVTPHDFLHPRTPEKLIPLVDWIGRRLERTWIREIAGSLVITGRKKE